VDWLDLLQWPAFAVTVAAGWLVASDRQHWRLVGFVLFLLSNVLWVAWGWHAAAWALVALQGFLVITNLRGVADNRE
jgi:O-antigen/teichoic acid export membrane protein